MTDVDSSMLVLVRHGRTVADAALPPDEWPMSNPEACERLRPALPDWPVVSSPERKAIETAAALGRPFEVDPRLREVRRPWTGDPIAFREFVARYLSGELLEGWEPQSVAVARFASAATGIVVSHGTVMSLFVAARVGVDPVEFFEGLTMPDAWLVSDGRLERIAG